MSPYHDWSDDTFDWEGLDKAGDFIREFVETHTFCTLIYKEKYGTLRYEHVLPPFGKVMFWGKYLKVPFYKRTRTYTIAGKSMSYTSEVYLFHWNRSNSLYRLWERWGFRSLEKGIDLACEQWPELELEIRADFDWMHKE